MRRFGSLAFVLALSSCGPSEATPDDAGSETDAPAATADGGSRADAGYDAGEDDCEDPDRDGDGSDSLACGGLDCDDDDRNRHPGNAETCDTAGHDEDCDPETFGFRDADGDTFPDSRCCNVDDEDGRHCGSDCDDAQPAIHGGLPEACNLLDDDCDGAIDELVQRSFWPDADGDDFGDAEGTVVKACDEPDDTAENDEDCDDAAGAINPSADEECNGIDDDCSGAEDDHDAETSCSLFSVEEPACVAGACAIGSCLDGYDDCDGSVSNGCEANLALDVDNCGECANACTGAATCRDGDCEVASCPGGTHACGSDCVDSTVPETCGTRCTPCPDPATDGSATCVSQTCGMACDSASFVLAGGDCVWNDPSLGGLVPGAGMFAPAFAPSTTDYLLQAATGAGSISLTPTAPSGATVTITVDGATVASGAARAVTLASGAEEVVIVVTAESGATRTYRVHVRRKFAESGYLKAGNVAPGRQRFGTSIAMDGDTIVVGAAGEDAALGMPTSTTLTESGAAYVYVRQGGAWVQQGYLKASNAGADDRFGTSVAISGDTIVVGAGREDSTSSTPNDAGYNVGAAYVFVRSGNVWTQQAYLKPSVPSSGGIFGLAVAIEGDRIVVGAPGDDGAGGSLIGSGAAFVFQRAGTTWTERALLRASNADAYDAFGYDVAVDGDVIAIGATGEDGGYSGVGADPNDDALTDSGAAYVFGLVGGAWTQQTYFKASNPGTEDAFGASVAIDGGTLAVGAMLEDGSVGGIAPASSEGASNAGAVYVFERAGASWAQPLMIKASVPRVNAELGWSIALEGDTMVVAAPWEDGEAIGIDGSSRLFNATDSGAAYVFVRVGSTWSQQHYVKASNAEALDTFGYDVAMSGDLFCVAAVGERGAVATTVPDTANGLAEAGAAYVFTR